MISEIEMTTASLRYASLTHPTKGTIFNKIASFLYVCPLQFKQTPNRLRPDEFCNDKLTLSQKTAGISWFDRQFPDKISKKFTLCSFLFMNLLVVGATGTLGRQVVRRALDEGYQVRCLVRNPKKSAFLREWGADLVKADLCDSDTLPFALKGVNAVIDASTTRATDSQSIWQVDWEGKVALIQAAYAAKVEHFIFFSILNAEKYPHVPLMDIKACTEKFLAESGLNYTVLQLSGFMQNLIAQYAIPILEKQTVWIAGGAIAYMNTQDIARFAVRALSVPETRNRTFPVVGTRAWESAAIVELCERLSEQPAKTARARIETMRIVQKIIQLFEWGWNLADRLAFAEVLATGQPVTAPMDDVYTTFGLEVKDTTTLESYLNEYFSRIMKKLKEMGYEQEKDKKKKTPF